jgi:ribonuclease HII
MAEGHQLVAGVDEVGRGSWAGPLVAAAVILPLQRPYALRQLSGCRDSKELSASQREALLDVIRRRAEGIGVGWVSHHVIDEQGLTFANRRALHRAVLALPRKADALLIDAFRIPECDLPQVAIEHGDAKCLSIAAASIVAKVVRDRWMVKYDRRLPEYGFGENKGYGTRSHREALLSIGPSPLHRQTFMPVALAST